MANNKRFGWIKERSTADLLVLLISSTICISTFLYGAVVSVLVFVQPQKDHSEAVTLLSNTFQMLIGLLAGFIAGRNEKQKQGNFNGAEKDER